MYSFIYIYVPIIILNCFKFGMTDSSSLFDHFRDKANRFNWLPNQWSGRLKKKECKH